MENLTILILGGYGNVGSRIAELLIRETTGHAVVLAGRRLHRATKVAETINTKYKTQRVATQQLDASDKEYLTKLLKTVQLLVVACPVTIYTSKVIAEAAMTAKVNYYFDMQVSNPLKNKVLQESLSRSMLAQKVLEESLGPIPTIPQQRKCFITNGGFHPGISAALGRYAYDMFCQDIHKANLHIISRPEEPCEYSHQQSDGLKKPKLFLGHDDSRIFTQGKWQQRQLANDIKGFFSCDNAALLKTTYDYGAPFRHVDCVPSIIAEAELHNLSKSIPSLQEMDIQVAADSSEDSSDDFILDMCKTTPIVGNILLDACVGWMCTPSQEADTPLANGSMVVLQGEGKTKTRSTTFPPRLEDNEQEEVMRFRLSLFHKDAHYMTAVCSVACLLQLLKTIKKEKQPEEHNPSGLHQQGDWVEPRQFFHDVRRMGIEMKQSFVTL